MLATTVIVLLQLLAISTVTNAASVLKVPFSSKLLPKFVPKGLNLKARADPLPNAPLSNAVVKVVTPVQSGDSQTFKDVLIDTGSAILWVGGEDAYKPGPNTQTLNSTFSVGYGTGGVNGTAFRDKVTIGDAAANAQIIGAANFTTGFDLVKPIDGILGLGPSGSNAGQVSGFNTTPTFVETLASQGSVASPLFGIFISPLGENGAPEGTGEITFGGIDETRIQGDVTWIPQNPPLNFHWEFNVSGFSFGNISFTEPGFTRTDTGVLDIGIPFDQFFDIINTYQGNFATTSMLAGFLNLPANVTSTLPDLTFTLASNTVFTIPPARYLVPRELYESLGITGDDAERVWTWIASAGPNSYSFGQKWLENVYTAYDLVNHRVGFAHLS